MERRCALLEINQQLKVAVKLEEQTLRKVSSKVLTGLIDSRKCHKSACAVNANCQHTASYLEHGYLVLK